MSRAVLFWRLQGPGQIGSRAFAAISVLVPAEPASPSGQGRVMMAVKGVSLTSEYYLSGSQIRIEFCTRSDRDATQGCSTHSLTVGRHPVCMDMKLADLQSKGDGAQLSIERRVWSAGQSTKKGLGRAESRKKRQHRAGMNMILDVATAEYVGSLLSECG